MIRCATTALLLEGRKMQKRKTKAFSIWLALRTYPTSGWECWGNAHIAAWTSALEKQNALTSGYLQYTQKRSPCERRHMRDQLIQDIFFDRTEGRMESMRRHLRKSRTPYWWHALSPDRLQHGSYIMPPARRKSWGTQNISHDALYLSDNSKKNGGSRSGDADKRNPGRPKICDYRRRWRRIFFRQPGVLHPWMNLPMVREMNTAT